MLLQSTCDRFVPFLKVGHARTSSRRGTCLESWVGRGWEGTGELACSV